MIIRKLLFPEVMKWNYHETWISEEHLGNKSHEREWYFLPSLCVLITLFLTSLDTIRQLAGQRHTESSWQTQMHYAHYAQHHTGGGWVICPSFMHICWYKTNDSYRNLALTLKLHISWWFILAGPNGAASKIKRTLTPAKKSIVSKKLKESLVNLIKSYFLTNFKIF